MRKSTDNVRDEFNLKDEFLIPRAKSKKCGKCGECSKCGKYGKGVLKCCSIIALTLGLNAFSFYVGYLLASEDNSESL
jgi:hypothetical protein